MPDAPTLFAILLVGAALACAACSDTPCGPGSAYDHR